MKVFSFLIIAITLLTLLLGINLLRSKKTDEEKARSLLALLNAEIPQFHCQPENVTNPAAMEYIKYKNYNKAIEQAQEYLDELEEYLQPPLKYRISDKLIQDIGDAKKYVSQIMESPTCKEWCEHAGGEKKQSTATWNPTSYICVCKPDRLVSLGPGNFVSCSSWYPTPEYLTGLKIQRLDGKPGQVEDFPNVVENGFYFPTVNVEGDISSLKAGSDISWSTQPCGDKEECCYDRTGKKASCSKYVVRSTGERPDGQKYIVLDGYYASPDVNNTKAQGQVPVDLNNYYTLPGKEQPNVYLRDKNKLYLPCTAKQYRVPADRAGVCKCIDKTAKMPDCGNCREGWMGQICNIIYDENLDPPRMQLPFKIVRKNIGGKVLPIFFGVAPVAWGNSNTIAFIEPLDLGLFATFYKTLHLVGKNTTPTIRAGDVYLHGNAKFLEDSAYGKKGTPEILDGIRFNNVVSGASKSNSVNDTPGIDGKIFNPYPDGAEIKVSKIDPIKLDPADPTNPNKATVDFTGTDLFFFSRDGFLPAFGGKNMSQYNDFRSTEFYVYYKYTYSQPEPPEPDED